MSKFALPQEVTETVKDSMKDNSGIKLPFAAPIMWWMNGKTVLKNEAEIKDARRFGGWGVSKEDIDEQGIEPAQSWKLTDLTNAKGDSYQAYICRAAWVAPIARRFAWFENEGKWRTSINILAYLFLRNAQGEFAEYGAVVLSAKSYTGKDLEATFKKFAAMTNNLRDNTPPQFFLHGIGTFGDVPQFQDAKGKGGESSSITPPQLAIPQNGFTPELMEKYFVGQEVAAKMAQLAKDAQEWLDDWNKRGKKQQEVLPVLQESADEYSEF